MKDLVLSLRNSPVLRRKRKLPLTIKDPTNQNNICVNKLAGREILRSDLEVHMEKYKKLVSSNYLFGSFYQTLLIVTYND